METDSDAAARWLLHPEHPILRCAKRALCCSMHLRSIRRGGAMEAKHGSCRRHGHGQLEADAMVLASL